MPSITKRAELHVRPGPTGSDTLVFICMALVAAAMVVGLHRQLGFPLAASAVAGLILFVGLLGFEIWRRGEAERAALSAELRRLELELSEGRAVSPDQKQSGAVPRRGGPVQPFPPAAPAELNPNVGEPIVDAGPELPRAESPQFETYTGAPAVAPGESLSDYWQEGDAVAALERGLASLAPDQSSPVQEPSVPVPQEAPPAAASTLREDDVEMLQRRIKEMLYQVTAAEQARDLLTAQPAEPRIPGPVEAGVAGGVEASVDALNAAVQSMRKTGGSVSAYTPPANDPDPLPTAVTRGHAIREAIAAGRVDVFLEPILGLKNQTAQHYEVSIKLRGPATEDLGDGDGEPILNGQGLLPLFDTVRIERSAIVAERLASRGKGGAVFSRTSGEALIEPEFTRNMQMDFVARPATAQQLILTFAQADVRSFRAAEQRAVSALSALGFRFAISALTDLDMNFAAMAKAGFCFVKLDASVLTDGLPHPGGTVPAHDVCRFLADQGFGLIVEGIDSEETLGKVFGFGVLMGQGTLFGGRRPVRADVAVKREHAAA